MHRTIKKIAILADNPALNDLLAQALEAEDGVAVYAFASMPALVTLLRIAPVDLLLLDADSLGDAAETVSALRRLPQLVRDDFQVVLLSRAAEPFHVSLLASGADLVLRKPVTPAVLIDQLTLRLWPAEHLFSADGIYRGPERRMRPATPLPPRIVRHDNVVPLFR